MNIPKSEIEKLSPAVREKLLQWDDYMYRRVRFNMPDSEIHATAHCERVLLYALILGENISGDVSDALDILAHADRMSILIPVMVQERQYIMSNSAETTATLSFIPNQRSLCVTMTLMTLSVKRLSESISAWSPTGC